MENITSLSFYLPSNIPTVAYQNQTQDYARMLKYCNFEEYSICIFLWSLRVLSGEPLVLLCTPMLLIRRTNKSHEVSPLIVKVGH